MTKLIRPACLVAWASLAAGTAFAAPTYSLLFQRSGFGSQYQVSQSTPLSHTDSYAVPGSVNATFSGSGFSMPGHVGMDNQVEQFWTGGTAGAVYEVISFAKADDFVISGPPGQVTGQFHLRVRATLNRSSTAQITTLRVDSRAKFAQFAAIGDLLWNSAGISSSGVLSGVASPDVDVQFVLSGTFTVGAYFDVTIEVRGRESTSGNSGSTPNPGWARTDAGSNSSHGLFLEEVGGQVMTLPAGYTVNSSSWGVVDNHFHSIVDVGPATNPESVRLSSSPNPFVDLSTVSLAQPEASHVRLQIFDLSGRLVRTLADEWHAAGTQRFPWDGRADDGSAVGAGVFFARVEADGRIANHRIVRMR